MCIGNSLLLVPIAYLMSWSNESTSNIVLFVYAGIYFNIWMGGVASVMLCIMIRMRLIFDVLR
jgi:hypothetical protein